MDTQTMHPDENGEDAARKETQEFDPELVDEDGIHPPPAAQEAEPTLLEQEQPDKEFDEQSGHNQSWHSFKTP
jgi:hypothetical protein